MILAAGRGKRMMPLTKNTPKPLLKVGDRSIIEHNIRHLKNNGFNEIVINTAYLGQQIENKLGTGADNGISINYSHELELELNTGGGIKNALPLLGSEVFLVLNGDTLNDYPLKTLKNKVSQLIAAKILCHIILVPNPPHNTKGDFDIKNDYLVQHKTHNPWTFSGIGIYHPHFFRGHANNTNIALYQLLKQGIKNKTITAEIYQGFWCDIGTPKRLTQLQNYNIINFRK